jgi:thiamine biosynthesis lipoprotein
MKTTSIFLPLLMLLSLTGCNSSEHPIRLHGKTMGTTWSLTLSNPPTIAHSRQLQTQIEELLENINSLMSTWRADSEISRFNTATSTEWIDVSPQTYSLLQKAMQIHQQSGGAFDPTVSPLVELWGFGRTLPSQAIPDDSQIQPKLQHIGLEKLQLEDSAKRMRKSIPQLQLDLSAIAKGYAVDEVAQLVTASGIQDYLVEIGGEMRISGINPEAEPWRVAIEYPHLDKLRSAVAILNVTDAAIATSGDYRNFVEIDAKHYSHLIDPFTGRPVTHDTASVTVISSDCLSADAWATAFSVIGSRRGLDLANSLKIAVMFIDRDGDKLVTISSNKMMKYIVNRYSQTQHPESEKK